MAKAARDVNRVPTLIGVSTADGATPILLEVDPDTGRLQVDATLITGDIQIGAVEIKDHDGTDRAAVNTSNELQVRDDDAITALRGFEKNAIDDYTTASVTYFGYEKDNGEWWIRKLDESGNFPVFTHASVSNNPTLTTYTTAWAARATTAVYNDYSAAF